MVIVEFVVVIVVVVSLACLLACAHSDTYKHTATQTKILRVFELFSVRFIYTQLQLLLLLLLLLHLISWRKWKFLPAPFGRSNLREPLLENAFQPTWLVG